MDAVDFRLIRILQEDARTPNAEIARQLEMAPSAILSRIRKLEARGVLTGYEAQIDPSCVDVGLLAFIFVGVNEFGEMRSGKLLAAIPEVLEVHHVAGDDCWLVKVRTRDTASLGKLLNATIGTIPNVTSTRTTIVMDSVKETGRIPLPPLSQSPSSQPPLPQPSEAKDDADA